MKGTRIQRAPNQIQVYLSLPSSLEKEDGPSFIFSWKVHGYNVYENREEEKSSEEETHT